MRAIVGEIVCVIVLAACGGEEPAELDDRFQPEEIIALAKAPPCTLTAGGSSCAGPSISVLALAQDGVPGSGPANTVELVTDWVDESGAACPHGAGHWCAQVTAMHFYPTTLPNVYAQITAITDDFGTPLPGWEGSNSSSGFGLYNGNGLWLHSASLAPGVGASALWEFKYGPVGADPTYWIRVVSVTP